MTKISKIKCNFFSSDFQTKPIKYKLIKMVNKNSIVLDVDAFERLLGPCMDLMKRSIGDYETQLIKIFGSKNNITDVR